jgi:1,4-dihydroxy-2-naphthoate octaprenyltransferase
MTVSWMWLAIRPKTLSMSAAPVLLGAALAWSEGAEPQWLVFFVTLFCALAIQAGTNLYNDARDAERGGDGPNRHGPLRVTATGLATAQQVKLAAYTAFGAAFAGGLYLVFVGGVPVLLIGVASLLAGFAYSGGPRPLSHTPWGEMFVLLFFGIAAVSGTYYLQLGEPRMSAVLLGVMLGLQAAAVLLVNNVRDLAADRAVGRRTLAIVIGERRSRWLYGAFMLLPFALFFWLPAAQGLWGVWLILPVAIWLVWSFRDVPVGPVMNRHLALTAQTQALMAVLISAGLLLRS